MNHRTALITAGSLALVVFAAAVAVGANMGILNAADSKPVGKLSAATPMTAAQPQTQPQMVSATPAAPAPPQKYLIKKAGQVSVAKSGSGVRLVSVDAMKGWRWTLTQTDNHSLAITFKKGKSVYTFKALVKNGAIAARVDHPITRTVQSASAPGSGGSGGGGSYYVQPAPQVATVAPAPVPAPKTASGGDSQPSGGGERDD